MASNPYGIYFPWRNVTATVVLAVALWGAPFAIWPRGVQNQGVGVGRPSMKVRFLGTVQGVDGSAWSPVVFPLPTKYGFSERVDTSGVGHDMAQVFQPRVSEGVFLALPAMVTMPAEVGVLEGGTGSEGFRPAVPASDVFGEVGGGEVEPWRMEMDGPLQGRQFTVAGLNAITPDAGGRGSVEAYVELDRSGAPLHVLLDRSSGSTNLDRAVVRALYSGRGRRGTDGDGGRVRLFFWRAADIDKDSGAK